MAPTTMPQQETTTTPFGRDEKINGYPIRMAELMAGLTGTSFVARCAVDTPKNLMRAKRILQRAFETQIRDNGFGFVEFLSACPTNWKMTPHQANEHVTRDMIDYYPLGVFKEERE
jgi:2-oxoglutarate ferredoxin oxidoreductase subunit beta